MKALYLTLVLSFVGVNAFAFTNHDQFRVELVKPWGEFGFRAIGKGKNITEMRFDCAKVADMGLVITTVNNYGKSNYIVLPAGKLGPDKFQCQAQLQDYFANHYTKRSLASLKNGQRTVELKLIRGEQTKRKLSFL